jgi:putative (di)nucleoside polyphosphate hydrolase
MSLDLRQSLPYRRGVGAVLFNGDGLVFIGRRINTAWEAWQLPQGGIDGDEKPKDAVRRELAEEIGTRRFSVIAKHEAWLRYDLPDDLLGKVLKGRYRGQEQRWFALRFTGQDADIDLAASGRPEFDAWRWIPLAQVPEVAAPFKRPIYDRLAADFAYLVDSY